MWLYGTRVSPKCSFSASTCVGTVASATRCYSASSARHMQTFKTSKNSHLSHPACARRCGHRRSSFRNLEARRPPAAPRSLADDEPPQLTEDWRSFRAKLVKEAQAQGVQVLWHRPHCMAVTQQCNP